MALYEHVFLARQDLAQAQVDALAANATTIIESNGGKVSKTETWGLRTLAYKIAKNRIRCCTGTPGSTSSGHSC